MYVDAAARDRARAVADAYLREISDDLAWADIVAGFDQDTSELDDVVPRWPASEDVDPADDRWLAAVGVVRPDDRLRGAAGRERPPLPSYAGSSPRTTRTTTSGRLPRRRCPTSTG